MNLRKMKHEMHLDKMFLMNINNKTLFKTNVYRTRPKRAYGRQGFRRNRQAKIQFWGVLNVSLCACGGQLGWWEKCSFFITLFRDSRGVPTGPQDTPWESAHFCHTFSWFTGGPNWPFRCLDCTQLCIWTNNAFFCLATTSPLYDRYAIEEVKTKENWYTYLCFRNPFIKFL